MTVLRIFFVIAFLPFAALSQTITTKKESSRIEGQNIAGYQIDLNAPEPEVKASLSKFLKTLGKTRTSGDYFTIVNPMVDGKSSNVTFYATTKQLSNTTAAWIGAPGENGEESSLDNDVKKLVRDFGIAFHREQIQSQIDESVRALQAVEKQQLRLVNQNKDLKNKVEGNKREKIALEKSLVDNKLELEDLTRKLAANAKAQDSVAIAGDQIKKVVELHKERQRNVN